MRKTLLLPIAILGIALIMGSCEKGPEISPKGGITKDVFSVAIPDYDCGEPLTVDLLAGKYTDIGEVVIEMVDGKLNVTYRVDVDGWYLRLLHLEVQADVEDIPQASGNPKIGLFSFTEPFDPPVKEYTFEGIEVDDYSLVYVAAHAEAVMGVYDPEMIIPELPGTVTFNVTYPYEGAESYFVIHVTGGMLTGDYNGWCIDTDNVIYEGTEYTANVISSLTEAGLAGLVEKPANFPRVNWIINQDFIGQGYTYGEIQLAIWTLLEDNLSTSGLGTWSQEKVDEIVALANESGAGFVPGCGDLVAIILQTVDEAGIPMNIQITIIQIPIECEYDGDETAWAAGNGFPGASWAMYVPYCIK